MCFYGIFTTSVMENTEYTLYLMFNITRVKIAKTIDYIVGT
jgi:hypothetical protein